ncbi:hypothetical protein HU200_045082 [Digitaria exilis]|uniref:[RNA-polymerase]-subunit kinase n=1 Tax=Digitaria exilis TaxID=1010633 RepID=A0A835B3H8_9POAL|nr:hypothetical protein HU200_045082 [Digitaria exilis]
MDRLAAAAGASRKRRRVCVGSTDVYEEVSGLGSGNFGAVVKARHRVTGQTVAIKRLTLSDADGRPSRGPPSRKLPSTRPASATHSIVGFHGVVRDPSTSRICLVMECVDGPSLHGLPPPTTAPAAAAPVAPPGGTGARRHCGSCSAQPRRCTRSRVIHRDIQAGEHSSSPATTGPSRSATSGSPCPCPTRRRTSRRARSSTRRRRCCWRSPTTARRSNAWSLGCVMAEIIAAGRRCSGKAAGDDDGQLVAIFRFARHADEETWPGFSSTPVRHQGGAGAEGEPENRCERSSLRLCCRGRIRGPRRSPHLQPRQEAHGGGCSQETVVRQGRRRWNFRGKMR